MAPPQELGEEAPPSILIVDDDEDLRELLALALRARGLGASWTTIHLAEHQEPMAKLSGLPDHVSQAVLMPVAYYTGETFKRATRPPVSQVLHINGW